MMLSLDRGVHWTEDHSHGLFEGLRMLLGLVFFVRGLHFIVNPELLVATFGLLRPEGWAEVLGYYIIAAHLVGGFMLGMGWLTRWAVALNVPVLIVVVDVWMSGAHSELNTGSLLLSLAMLLAMLIFAFYGSGQLSVDQELHKDVQPFSHRSTHPHHHYRS